jgi:hypothetical protein
LDELDIALQQMDDVHLRHTELWKKIQSQRDHSIQNKAELRRLRGTLLKNIVVHNHLKRLIAITCDFFSCVVVKIVNCIQTFFDTSLLVIFNSFDVILVLLLCCAIS